MHQAVHTTARPVDILGKLDCPSLDTLRFESADRHRVDRVDRLRVESVDKHRAEFVDTFLVELVGNHQHYQPTVADSWVGRIAAVADMVHNLQLLVECWDTHDFLQLHNATLNQIFSYEMLVQYLNKSLTLDWWHDAWIWWRIIVHKYCIWWRCIWECLRVWQPSVIAVWIWRVRWRWCLMPSTSWWCVRRWRSVMAILFGHMSGSQHCLGKINSAASFEQQLELGFAHELPVVLSTHFAFDIVRTEHRLLKFHLHLMSTKDRYVLVLYALNPILTCKIHQIGYLRRSDTQTGS